jgi:hypothetical protein
MRSSASYDFFANTGKRDHWVELAQVMRSSASYDLFAKSGKHDHWVELAQVMRSSASYDSNSSHSHIRLIRHFLCTYELLKPQLAQDIALRAQILPLLPPNSSSQKR